MTLAALWPEHVPGAVRCGSSELGLKREDVCRSANTTRIQMSMCDSNVDV